eukprot:6653689-Alexandrium_andersonii.AAC.1
MNQQHVQHIAHQHQRGPSTSAAPPQHLGVNEMLASMIWDGIRAEQAKQLREASPGTPRRRTRSSKRASSATGRVGKDSPSPARRRCESTGPMERAPQRG